MMTTRKLELCKNKKSLVSWDIADSISANAKKLRFLISKVLI